METALFSGIKDYIIERLNEANSIIRIAVAWFTNDDLYQVILQLLDKGVQVELIIIDDHINRNEFGLDFKAFITKGGHLYLSTPTKNMHNKFCIIDRNCVITGSYNWTYYAEKRNWENIITSNNESIVVKFANEFDAIKSKLSEVKSYCHIRLAEMDSMTLLNEYDYLYEDLYYKGNETGVEYSNILATIKNNIVIEKKDNTISDSANDGSFSPQKIVTQHSLGIRCSVEGNANHVYFLIPKGTEIPCEVKEIFFTTEDNQTALPCETLLGENVEANLNRSIGKIMINDIPPLPKGKGKMEVSFKVSSDKTLQVKATNLLTKTSVEARYYLNYTL